MARPTYFDCDTGIDDALALLLLARQEELRVDGIGTVSGNTSAGQAARNTLDLLPLVGMDVPVAVGGHDHLAHPFQPGPGHRVHGEGGTGTIALPRSSAQPIAMDAADLLIALARANPGDLEVVAVGPLTNVAVALGRMPGLPHLVRHITVMGGAALVPGNITPAAEANIYNDPEAAAAVFAAPWDLTMVGLDITMRNTLDERGLHRLQAARNPGAQAVAGMLDHYFDFYTGVYGRRSCALHDPLAVAIAAGLIGLEIAPKARVEIDTTEGPDRGRTVCDLRSRFLGYPDQPDAHVRIALEAGQELAPVLLDLVAR